MRYCDKWGNKAKLNPFNKVKRRRRFPNFKTYIRFGMNKKWATDYELVFPEYTNISSMENHNKLRSLINKIVK